MIATTNSVDDELRRAFAADTNAGDLANVVLRVGERAGLPPEAMRDLSGVAHLLFACGYRAGLAQSVREMKEALHGKPA